MDDGKYIYKGFDIMNEDIAYKRKNEFFNPYGYNIYSSIREDNNDINSIKRIN